MAKPDQKMSVKDTSLDYEDMVGYDVSISSKNALEEIFFPNEKKQTKIKKNKKEKGFEEEWQILKVNFYNEQEYREFMQTLGFTGVSTTKEIIYQIPETRVNIFDF